MPRDTASSVITRHPDTGRGIGMDPKKKSLGQKLKELRENYDLSQQQVASALNIDRSTYGYYELDKTRPSLETLVRLSHIFSVPAEQLLPTEEEDAAVLSDLCQPSSMVRSLTKDERGLLTLFRSLTKAQKKQVLAELTKYVKDHTD